MNERIRSAVSRFPIATVAVAVLAGYLVGRGCSSSRYAIAGVSNHSHAAAYVLDTWTGRVRLWDQDEEQKTKTIADQEREKIVEAKRNAEQLKRRVQALHDAATWRRDGGLQVAAFREYSTQFEVSKGKLWDFAKEHPYAEAVPDRAE